MKAMVLHHIVDLEHNLLPLEMIDTTLPSPGAGELLLEVSACGVCHTELDIIEGRTMPGKLPLILGHQVVGRVIHRGGHSAKFVEGTRVGVAWIFSACGECEACRCGNENLCQDFHATGRDANGGYAEYMTVPESYVYPIPDTFTDTQAAPLLCAGAIGYRSLRLCDLRDGHILGLAGFGASAHLVLSLARSLYPNSRIFVFTRNPAERQFALELGASWAGAIDDSPPVPPDAIIDTTPAWKPVIAALEILKPGGRLVINAIRKQTGDQTALLHLDYARHLWMEKEIKSVANVTRRDVIEFLDHAAAIPIHPEVQEYRLEDANTALMELKAGKIRGAKVLRINSSH